MKKIIHNSRFISLLCLLLLSACAGPSTSMNTNSISSDLKLINQYSADYFVGIGKGSSPSENIALKIARANALGELSSNVKVFITSKLEVEASESSSGLSSESVSQKIVEIGNATIRSPEYEILKSNQNSSNGNYDVKIIAKKLKSDHFEEASKSLNINDNEKLINFLLNDEN